MNISELKMYNQEHLKDYIVNLNECELAEFNKNLSQVDIKKINELYLTLVNSNDAHQATDDLVSIEAFKGSKSELSGFKNKGIKAIQRGEIAVLLLAGGQGSRLGHLGPKGTFDLKVEGASSLFEIQANSFKAIYANTGVYVDWYIMTSYINHQDTVDFFVKHQYFGYPKSSIIFFEQGSIEAVDDKGRLMMASKTELVKSPDGNGGCIKALKDNQIVDHLLNKGAKWLFIYNVDNAITNIADPTFIGYAIEASKPVSVKVVAKNSPDEKVGVPCLADGKPTIVEYTEIGEKRANLKKSDGTLVYDGANIGNYLIALDALKTVLEKPLCYHLAHKKIPFVDSFGELVTPDMPNGYKFELFIFDIFKSFDGMSVFEGVREDDFAPVKNKDGKDSPETARKLYNDKMCR